MAAAVREAEVITQPLPFSVNSREQLLMSIRGSRVVIPDLQSMISHWPHGTHPEVERLDGYVQKMFTCLLSSSNNETRFQKLKASNIALFGATWWPYASYEALEIVTCLSIWLFAWDDETDSLEFSTVINDWDKASVFRQNTINYVQQILSKNSELGLSEISPDPIIGLFKPVGEAVSESCNDRQISTFLDELLFYFNMCGEEQKLQVAHHLPTVEEYVRLRLGSGAVRVCLATIEYAYGITLPQQMMDDEAMQRIWHEANIIISTSSIERFDTAESEILKRYSTMPKVQEDIHKFVDGCKYACTSNLNWRHLGKGFFVFLGALQVQPTTITDPTK
ncbi:hypothetical protein M434DRAFT_8886 [Hypoxylon sp. CO27-5]|nr:hypothetical protein M434DRAFT_8886 [Hypoxylon sp. CO27-5]